MHVEGEGPPPPPSSPRLPPLPLLLTEGVGKLSSIFRERVEEEKREREKDREGED